MKPPLLSHKLSILSKEVNKCTECELYSLCKHKVTYRIYSPPSRPNPIFADYLIIGEAPGQSEYSNKEPFVGPAGDTLNEILNESLLPNTSYVITNSILCTPFKDDSLYTIRTPYLSEIEECLPNLIRLAKLVKPKGYIAAGVIAERAVTRLCKQLPKPWIRILHPSKIRQSEKYRYEMDNAVLILRHFQQTTIPDYYAKEKTTVPINTEKIRLPTITSNRTAPSTKNKGKGNSSKEITL